MTFLGGWGVGGGVSESTKKCGLLAFVSVLF